MKTLDFPSSLRRLANDVHRHTWFVQRGTSLSQEKVIATLRGTRPGSPVADIGFNLLMSDILQERIRADETISGAGSEYPVTLPPVTWVDDLAVPVATSSPGDLEKVITAVLQHIHETFYSRGLQINYDKGKTEVVVMHRGEELKPISGGATFSRWMRRPTLPLRHLPMYSECEQFPATST